MSRSLKGLAFTQSDETAAEWAEILRSGGYRVEWVRVSSGADLLHAATHSGWDVVLADHLPADAFQSASDQDAVALWTNPVILAKDFTSLSEAARAVRAGVFDCVEHRDAEGLLQAVERALNFEQRPDSSRALLKMMVDMALELGQCTEVGAAAEIVLKAVMRIPEVDAGAVHRIEGGMRLVLVHELGCAPEFAAQIESVRIDEDAGHFLYAEEAVFRDLASAQNPFGKRMAAAGFLASGVIPIGDHPRPSAVLNVCSHGVSQFSPAARSALTAVGAHLSAFIQRLRAGEQLRESERRFRSQYKGFPLPAFSWKRVGEDYVLADYNDAAEKITWGRVKSLLGKTARQMYWDEPELADFIHKAYSSRSTFSEERYYRFRSTGETRYAVLHHTYVSPDFVVVHMDDITSRRRAEEELRQSNRKFQVIFEGALDGIFVIDPAWGLIIQTNPAAAKMLGYAQSELIGRRATELYTPQSQELLEHWKQTLRIHGAVFESQYFTRADGTAAPMDLTATLVPWEGESAILLTLRDVSERMEAEAERKRLVEAVEQVPESILIANTEGAIQYVNKAFEHVTGYTREEARGQTPRLLKSGRHAPAFYEELWNTIAKGGVWHGRIANARKDGSIFTEDATISPIKNNAGQIIGYAAVKKDVTDEAQIEARMRQAQKMEAIGTLAGGIAHDFNNILSPIIGYTDMLLQDAPEGGEQRQCLEEVYRAAERARELVKQILTFSRQVEQAGQPVEVALIVKEALKLMRASIPATISIETDISPKTGCVMGDPVHIHQILMNLCTNAYHAMRESGGVMKVGLKRVRFETQKAGLGLGPGEYVRLTVSDQGTGMTEEVAERIFEPFFTTKRAGEGTGMGLSTVNSIVTGYNGVINVDSAPNTGAVFTVYLPALPREEGKSAAPAQETVGGAEQILLVDDEGPIAYMMEEMLERLGYFVTAKLDSREALEMFREDPRQFDVLITDMTMPSMTGDELARQVLGIRPDMPIVIMTGFSERFSAEDAKRLGIDEFVLKPVASKDLAAAVRRALGDSPQALDA